MDIHFNSDAFLFSARVFESMWEVTVHLQPAPLYNL